MARKDIQQKIVQRRLKCSAIYVVKRDISRLTVRLRKKVINK